MSKLNFELESFSDTGILKIFYNKIYINYIYI